MKAMCISKIVFIIIGFAVLTSHSGQWEVFTCKNDVRDIALAGNTLWSATSGGVVAWNPGDNSYKSYTTTDGLLSCDINQVAIDKKGRPWVATKEPSGLFLYENHTWKQIKVGGSDNDIGDKIISGLEIDRFGNVWVYTRRESNWYIEGTEDSYYLWRYDGRAWHKHEGVYGPITLDPRKNLLAVDSLIICNDMSCKLRFIIASFNGSKFIGKWSSKLDDQCANIALKHIALDSKGNAWISYIGERSGETFGVVCDKTLYNTLDGLADNNVRSITADESGTVWCATDGGISKFNGLGWVTYNSTYGVASNLVYKILIGDDNTLYAATSKGISILKSNKWKTLKTINEPSHNNYTDVVIDKRGAVILSGGDHIANYNNLQWKMNYFRNIRVGDSEYGIPWYCHLPNSRYVCKCNKSFIKTEDGTLYAIGNEIEKGCILKQGTDGRTFFELFSHTTEKRNRIMSPAVVSSGNNTCFWLTGLYRDLILFNKQKVAIFPPDRFGVGGNPETEISCILLDSDRRSVWLGYQYGSAGIVHFDGDTVKKRINENDGLASNWITAIARDSSENLWFASSRRKHRSGGVTVLRNPAVQKFIFRNSSLCTHNRALTKYLRDRDGKEFGSCNALFVDNSGIVWMHSDHGIARFDGSSWKLFDSAEVSPDLPYVGYSHILQDQSGTVWFGTSGSGLLAHQDNRWSQFTTRDGIPCNFIRGCALDSKDNLWILTDNGIAMRRSGGMVHNHTRGDFLDPEYNRVIKQRGNRFYISSKDKPEIIQYILFDLRGRVIHRQTIHRGRSFVLPGSNSNFPIGSGLRILSITSVPEGTDGTQNKYLLKIGDIK